MVSHESAPSSSPPRPGFFRRIGQRLARLHPAPRTRKGGTLLLLLCVMVLGAWIAAPMTTGWTTTENAGAGAAVALALSLLIWLSLQLIPDLLRLGAAQFGGLGFATLIASFFLLRYGGLPDGVAARLGAAAGLVLVLFGGGLAAITSPERMQAARWRRLAAMLCLALGLGGLGYGGWWWTRPGDTASLVEAPGRSGPTVEALELADPNLAGPHDVETLTYGAGQDRWRPEFAAEAQLKSRSFDASAFVDLAKGWRGRVRKAYWEFDAEAFPLNGRIFAPKGDGPWPLVLIVHGNHRMNDFSDPGYGWIGKHLASRGHLCVSVDQNFLNSDSFSRMRKENDARAIVLLEHLKLWREWNATAGHRFQGKVDLSRIALIGHSRGGEAVAHAAAFNRLKRYPDDATIAFDYGFDLCAIVAIAPVDQQYRPADHPGSYEGVSTFVIHGSHDADVSSFQGDRIFNRVRIAPETDHFKASWYVYRANHGQFNTVWGDTDVSSLSGRFLNRTALLAGEEQRRIGTVAITAFLAATLGNQPEWRALFRDPRRGEQWLPDTWLLSRYEDARFQLVADFEEDYDVHTGTLDGVTIASEGLATWREEDREHRGGGRRDDHAVVIGWRTSSERQEGESKEEGAAATSEQGAEPDATDVAEGDSSVVRTATSAITPHYAINLPHAWPAEVGLDLQSALVFDLARLKEKPKAPEASKSERDEASNEEEDAAESSSKDTPLDLTIELRDAKGRRFQVRLADHWRIAPPLAAEMMRLDALESRYKSRYETILQTVRIPLAAFAAVDRPSVGGSPSASGSVDLDPATLHSIRLVFDRGGEEVITMDRIGFELP